MAAEEHKALYRRLVAALNSRDLEGAAALLAPDWVNHTPLPGEPPGIEGFRYNMGVLFGAFPDARFTLEHIVGDGDTVAARGTLRGTHSGPLADLPPTGRTVAVRYMEMLRVAEGRFVEHWAQVDQTGLLQQLGTLPAPGQAAS